MRRREFAANVERHLRKQADLHISVRLQGDALILEGCVGSAAAWEAAQDLAAGMAPEYRIENHLELEELRPDVVRQIRIVEATDLTAADNAPTQFQPSEHEPSEANVTYPARDSGSGESGEPFIPPMDPTFDIDSAGKPRILGGFGLSSLDDISVDASSSDASPGDEALADAVRRELREDVATTALDIRVEVWDRVAHLSGVVAGAEDADAAESVAARVPGLAEVADDLVIGTSPPHNAGSTSSGSM
jgi:osmotically-inducible protein OsmY